MIQHPRSFFAFLVALLHVATASAQTVYVADLLGNQVSAYDLSGHFLFQLPNANLNGPSGLTVNKTTGELYVANKGNNTITRYGAGGTYLGLFANTNLDQPIGLAFDTVGNLYAANFHSSTSSNQIQKFSPTGTFLSTFATTGLSGPNNIAFDASGNLFVANYGNGKVEKYFAGGGHISFVTGLVSPVGVAFDSLGNLYVTNDFHQTVQVYNSSGTLLRSMSTYGYLDPQGIVLDSSDNLLVAEYKLNLDNSYKGAVEEFSSTGIKQSDFIPVFSQPFYTPSNTPQLPSAVTIGYPVPEPGSLILLGLGAAFGLVSARRRNR